MDHVHFCLEPAEKRSLEHAVTVLRPDVPLPVVVVSHPYGLLLDNWIAHVHRLGITRFLVVAMDDAMDARLRGQGMVVARANFDGSAADFWLRRMLVWRHLIKMGVDVIQSDIDALWFRDPMKTLPVDQPFDLLCTQGTLHPMAAVQRWGFVLCTGLMWIRSCPPSVKFFDTFADHGQQVLQSDDQAVLNNLLADSGLLWEKTGTKASPIEFDGVSFDTYPRTLWGLIPDIGLRVGMLPHDFFPRLPVSGADVIVRHLLRPEDDGNRIDELKTAGCWLLDQ
jgi:hypothetical protein